jgi:hypothetical protein
MVGVFRGEPDSAQAQGLRANNMQVRVNQLNNILREGPQGGVDQAMDMVMQVLYGGARPLPTLGVEENDVIQAAIAANELMIADTLQQVAFLGDRFDPQMSNRALSLKFALEEIEEVARAVGVITRQCGENMVIGDDNPQNPCNDLVPLLDEATGHVGPAGAKLTAPITIRPSFSVKLRSPIVPRNTTLRWEEDLITTQALADGECSVVFKETRGLMYRLHYDRFTVVKDPWVSVVGFPRGTTIPIWSLEFVPSEYVKQFEICNNGGSIKTTVTQRVKQDRALNFFWRYYPRNNR